jgi:hypothetical protein
MSDEQERKNIMSINTSYKTNLSKLIFQESPLPKLDDLANLLGKGCRLQTKARLCGALQYINARLISGLGYQTTNRYERVQYDSEYGWSYCAGQCYRSELRRVRELILKS